MPVSCKTWWMKAMKQYEWWTSYKHRWKSGLSFWTKVIKQNK